MGQSVSITALSAGSAGINVRELEDLTYEKTLSSARFMKCVRARHRDGLVVIKVAMRPPPDFKLTQYAKAIRRKWKLLESASAIRRSHAEIYFQGNELYWRMSQTLWDTSGFLRLIIAGIWLGNIYIARCTIA